MLEHWFTFRHLRAEEFVNVADGRELSARRRRHLDGCAACRATLESINEVAEDIADPEFTEAPLAEVDWMALRSSVRDRLLARAVKRRTSLRRWTGWQLTPAAAWTLTLLILVSGMTAGGLWHYRTAHLGGAGRMTVTAPEALEESAANIGLQGSVPVDADTLAWSQTEIFTSLNELEAGEEAVLRELISVAFSEGSATEESMLQ